MDWMGLSLGVCSCGNENERQEIVPLHSTSTLLLRFLITKSKFLYKFKFGIFFRFFLSSIYPIIFNCMNFQDDDDDKNGNCEFSFIIIFPFYIKSYRKHRFRIFTLFFLIFIPWLLNFVVLCYQIESCKKFGSVVDWI